MVCWSYINISSLSNITTCLFYFQSLLISLVKPWATSTKKKKKKTFSGEVRDTQLEEENQWNCPHCGNTHAESPGDQTDIQKHLALVTQNLLRISGAALEFSLHTLTVYVSLVQGPRIDWWKPRLCNCPGRFNKLLYRGWMEELRMTRVPLSVVVGIQSTAELQLGPLLILIKLHCISSPNLWGAFFSVSQGWTEGNLPVYCSNFGQSRNKILHRATLRWGKRESECK